MMVKIEVKTQNQTYGSGLQLCKTFYPICFHQLKWCAKCPNVWVKTAKRIHIVRLAKYKKKICKTHRRSLACSES